MNGFVNRKTLIRKQSGYCYIECKNIESENTNEK